MDRGEIVEKFYPELEQGFVAYAQKLVSSRRSIEPDDMVQQAVLVYLKGNGPAPEGHGEVENFRNFMKAVIRNIILDTIRRTSRSCYTGYHSVVVEHGDPARIAEAEEQEQRVRGKINGSLTADGIDFLHAREGGMSIREAEQNLGKKRGWGDRTNAKIRGILKSELDPPPSRG